MRPGTGTGATASSVEEVLDLYARWGPERYDEDISQLDHALQCAALADAEHAPPALVAAALLHDVGHLLHLRATDGRPGSFATDRDHERVGADWLAGLFPASVTDPIRLHVAAKRYRCAVDPAYAAGLSAGSTASLAVQGGPMAGDELAAFEALPGHAEAVRLRGWDDGGKLDGDRLDRPDPGSLADRRELLSQLAGG